MDTMPESFNEGVTQASDYCTPKVAQRSSHKSLSSSPLRRSERIRLRDVEVEQHSISLEKNMPSSGQNRKKRGRPGQLILEDWGKFNAQVKDVNVNDLKVCTGEPSNMSKQICDFGARPISCPIWRGNFSVCSEKFGLMDGLAAHMSNKACTEVFEVARHLPALLQSQMIPRLDVWPQSFNSSGPTDNVIDPYIFPENERSEREFDSLLNYMTRQDLAVKAVVDDIVLLVFTSLQLPHQYWRTLGKYYLWAVFSGKNAEAQATDIPSSKEAEVLAGVETHVGSLEGEGINPLQTETPHSTTPKVSFTFVKVNGSVRSFLDSSSLSSNLRELTQGVLSLIAEKINVSSASAPSSSSTLGLEDTSSALNTLKSLLDKPVAEVFSKVEDKEQWKHAMTVLASQPTSVAFRVALDNFSLRQAEFESKIPSLLKTKDDAVRTRDTSSSRRVAVLSSLSEEKSFVSNLQANLDDLALQHTSIVNQLAKLKADRATLEAAIAETTEKLVETQRVVSQNCQILDQSEQHITQSERDLVDAEYSLLLFEFEWTTLRRRLFPL